MREVDFIFVAGNAGTNVVTAGLKVTGSAASKLGISNAAVIFLAGKDTPVLLYVSGRTHGGDFTEIKKKQRSVSSRLECCC